MTRIAIEDLIAKDAHVRTPVLGLPLLVKTLTDDDIEMRDLVTTVEKFPSITARLLSVANSAWSSPRAPITTLHGACTHLGLRLIRSVSISLAVAAPFNVMRCKPFDAARFWHGSLLVADAAERLANRCRTGTGCEPNAVRTAGLLHNLGMLWLADKVSDELARACELASRAESTTVNEELQRAIGTDSSEVGGLLLQGWGLPSVLVAAIQHHRDPDRAETAWECAALLGGGAHMVWSVHRGHDCPTNTPHLERLGIRLSDLREVFDEVCAVSHRTQALAEMLV